MGGEAQDRIDQSSSAEIVEVGEILTQDLFTFLFTSSVFTCGLKVSAAALGRAGTLGGAVGILLGELWLLLLMWTSSTLL